MGYRKISLFLCLFLFVIGCKKKDCEEVINQVYIYPIEAAKGKSFDERIKMFKIPDLILHCLSTEALVNSCLDYPEIGLTWAWSGQQEGIDHVRSMCNGFDELWKRGDKFKELYSLYQQKNFTRDWDSYTDLENGRYLIDINEIELIISQYEILHDLSVYEKTELFQLTLDNQKKKVELIKYWGVTGMETTCAILGRIMYLDNYQPLVEEYKNNEIMFLSVAEIFILDYDIVNKVMSLSEDYLKILKSKQK